MFKLIKILNSGSNVPEPCLVEKSSTLKVNMGCALVLSGGKASTCSSTSMPTHIARADGPKGTTSVMCYPITSDMVFETIIYGDPTVVFPGEKITLCSDEDGCTVAVTDELDEGVATIVDIGDAKKFCDKISIKFC